MLLSELEKGECARIISVCANDALKQRLHSFGINKGGSITVEEITLAKNTIEISIQRTRVALRISEASEIEVERC